MTAKTRRPHRKSRNGCIECKYRHIRCDERRPSCANCECADRTCSFLTPQTIKHKQKQVQHLAKQQQQSGALAASLPDLDQSNHSNPRSIETVENRLAELPLPLRQQQNNHAYPGQTPNQLSKHRPLSRSPLPSDTIHHVNAPQTPRTTPPARLDVACTPTDDCCPGLSNFSDAALTPIFTSQHLILMHHAYAVPNFIGLNRNVVDIATRHAVDSPYLLHEILAFTAFHMVSIYPGSTANLQHLATELQTRALTSFSQLTKSIANDDKATAVPRFLFSAILGRHVLADTLVHCRSNFHHFIDRFVDCLILNRGIRSVTPPAWDHLYNSELQPFIRVIREANEKIISPGNECNPLKSVMNDSDLNEESIKACRQAVDVLQWSFDICRSLDETDYPQSASAFCVRIAPGFVSVLRKHRPEALLILAYYGVLLHRCRSFWAFGNAGAALVGVVAEQLGNYWQDALAWPLQVLEAECSPGSNA